MEQTLLDKLLCPQCTSGDWTLDAAEIETLQYADGPREEIKSGRIVCSNGHGYPISQFVLSLESCFPEELEKEANYWNSFYSWHVTHGSGGEGLHDLKQGYAPFKTSGIEEPFPFADVIDRYDVHYRVAEHPLLRAGRTLLDVGVGLGWTTIHFARAGYEVTAFDPGVVVMQMAKAYAIRQGLFIEYLCAALGYVQFRPGSFDNVTAFHSLHHVPDMRAGLNDIARWLKPGGAFAVDEHIGNSKLAAGITGEIMRWAEEQVFPHYRTLSDEDLASLPAEPHSALEDAGIHEIMPLLHEMFTVHHEQERHTCLDHYSLLYYLSKGKEASAFVHSLEIANQLQEIIRRNDPEGGDYATIIATNVPPEASAPDTASTGAETPTSAQVTPAPDNETSLQTQVQALEQQIASLTDTLVEQAAWARSLEQAQQAKDSEIHRLQADLRKFESGRLMRALKAMRKLMPGKK